MLNLVIATIAVALMAWKSAKLQSEEGYAPFWRAFYFAFLGFAAVAAVIWGMLTKW